MRVTYRVCHFFVSLFRLYCALQCKQNIRGIHRFLSYRRTRDTPHYTGYNGRHCKDDGTKLAFTLAVPHTLPPDASDPAMSSNKVEIIDDDDSG